MKTKQKTVKADKASTQGRVPKLRFPEFRDAGVWEERRLEKVASFSKGKGISKSDVTNDGKHPCIRYGELYTLYNETIENVSSYTNISAKNLVLSKANDVIIPASGETQQDIATASCVINSDIALGGDLNIIRSKMNGVFLSYYLNSAKKKSIAQLSQGISVVHLYSSQLKKLDINIPDLPEQQKIADFLSSTDELIAAQAHKIDTLKAHKKGLMQQLFPAKGETVPKLRFPEFRDAWEEKSLDEIANYENGKAHERFISETGQYIVVNSKFISSDGEVVKFTGASFCLAAKKDILMVLSDVPNGKAIAKCFFVDSNNLYTVNQRICKLTATNVVSEFLFCILSRHSYFLSFDDGVKQTNLRKEDVLNCPSLLPKDPEEQQKIADCLSSIDELIAAQTQKLDTLKAHKKGLMQQLFPSSADEVNG